MSQPEAGHPVGPEIDDSPNPTEAAPAGEGTTTGAPTAAGTSAGTDPGSGHDSDYTYSGADSTGAGERGEQQGYSRDMLHQLQQMIDSLATHAGPVMRDVAAKAAELAAVAGERAGPLAHRAAEATERVGARVAERSKVMASDLRRPPSDTSATDDDAPFAPPAPEATDEERYPGS